MISGSILLHHNYTEPYSDNMHNGVLTKTDKLYCHWDGPEERVSILHQNVYSSSHFF